MSEHNQNILNAAFVNLGCRVNRVEVDTIASELQSFGVSITQENEADVIVINTCAVTQEAEAKTRKQVRRCANLPQKPLVIACGCSANLFRDDIEGLASNVVVQTNKAKVAQTIVKYFNLDITKEHLLQNTLGSQTPTGRSRPGIKIQDGCDNRCAYCIVWKARGSSTSLEVPEVLKQVKRFEEQGVKELVLTGINLAKYSTSYRNRLYNLAHLLDYLLEYSTIERFRLSSLEPPETTRELLNVIGASAGRIAPFLHLSLQSGSTSVLKRMNRNYTAYEYAKICDQARELIPNLALACDLIVGFPGETESEFEESLSFCSTVHFEKMHVFRYSKRPGTPAATMPDQVVSSVSSQRAQRARELSVAMRKVSAEHLVGSTHKILVQEPGFGVSGGLFDCEVPLLIKPNTMVDLEIVGVNNTHLIARPVIDDILNTEKY